LNGRSNVQKLFSRGIASNENRSPKWTLSTYKFISCLPQLYIVGVVASLIVFYQGADGLRTEEDGMTNTKWGAKELERTSRTKISQLLSACGLNCGWCPYFVMTKDELKCPGCWEREKCIVRDCVKEKRLKLCSDCDSFPCHNFLQGPRCIIERCVF